MLGCNEAGEPGGTDPDAYVVPTSALQGAWRVLIDHEGSNVADLVGSTDAPSDCTWTIDTEDGPVVFSATYAVADVPCDVTECAGGPVDEACGPFGERPEARVGRPLAAPALPANCSFSFTEELPCGSEPLVLGWNDGTLREVEANALLQCPASVECVRIRLERFTGDL